MRQMEEERNKSFIKRDAVSFHSSFLYLLFVVFRNVFSFLLMYFFVSVVLCWCNTPSCKC